ncbi:MAG: high light inducible protein [Oscillatoriales cyanobacterium]|uniref:Chlorophyll a/b-binding protein n=1 Tax=Microcoleus anatoxicus PTRS2 TaxID=2705321 RepID=A0ABU8YSJ4_9CYAN|nr:MAG: high light inducible protein [Oscillatoriales cyanobacterium]TAD95137.1 MAG: high light inducible protein [Oscillatoriales cyanobacterium]TAD98629.1 MAG: high light inducible protein [Oscillatoriales cyanobacterium]TAF06150.1 MAG: high light inducible protein [Oscillatoriales cyanobacterium]TAF31637.1 MAG: high light inducible protein [Oscillatoriales cyanobacterium]
MKAKTPASPIPPSPESAKKAEPAFGWNAYAEQINGRFAMVGFVAILLLEFFTGENFFTWLGLR